MLLSKDKQRTLFCGALTSDDKLNKTYTVNGWVDHYRDHGELVFIDLRDRSGIVQLVFDPAEARKTHELAKTLRREDVISAKGFLRRRGEGLENPRIATGAYELVCTELFIFNRSKTPPFDIHADQVNEEARLKYRYLDLRSPKMYDNLLKRSLIVENIRSTMQENGFLEVETPLLTRSTPEGARDFLVPSRLHKGSFYALPQSPQIFKQLLMVGGIERYYQIARCFRDEDLRADRQPEFTQLDIEMSFVTAEDIQSLIEEMLVRILKRIYNLDIQIPFLRMSYHNAMEKYGSDRPDLRFGMGIVDVSSIVSNSDFSVFTSVTAKGGMVKCLPVPNGDKLSRKDLDELISFVGNYGAKGMAWMRVKNGALESNIVKYFSEDIQQQLIKITGAEDGYVLLFIADVNDKIVYDAIGNLRLEIGDRFELRPKDKFSFLWVVDFPMLEKDIETGRWVSVHHPFTSPNPEDIKLLESNPGKVRASAYDVICNGIELGGGSIRIADSETQAKIFQLLNISEAEAQEKFGFLLDALAFGAPPHGGIALGLDRMVMQFQQLDSIRDVIAFPKTQKGTCPLTDAPSEVDIQQLLDLGIQVKKN
ncbi:aspartyl-tRNA synthetase [Brevinema andersonii]|uniref:Aspartate--tRNA(Asp/Asn) ligase n=1 Tax=Brevinema andersonii TaxID=34097 RepID=A0A1I1D5M2_BREAD|nr:aspartate--tRNA ligase [Brevinema andersonii]SFB70077.1 aspartyl-tRNA synthetase [Brevinema andersonii]